MLHFKQYYYNGKFWMLDYENDKLVGTEAFDTEENNLGSTYENNLFGSEEEWAETVKEIIEKGELIEEDSYDAHAKAWEKKQQRG